MNDALDTDLPPLLTIAQLTARARKGRTQGLAIDVGCGYEDLVISVSITTQRLEDHPRS